MNLKINNMWKLIDLSLNLVENPEGKWSNGYTIKDGQVYDHETDTWNELRTSREIALEANVGIWTKEFITNKIK
jgi:hypothetical protein